MSIPTDDNHGPLSDEDLAKPLTYPVDAFLSKEYLDKEKELLWPNTWQMAARLEDIPRIGDYITYNICDESIVIIRTAEDTIKAYYNVCPHRGRQLISTPDDQNCVRGRKKSFVCGFHGWQFNLEGENIGILDEEDWQGVLNKSLTCLTPVENLDTWMGWIYVNFTKDCESLSEFLGDVDRILSPFQFDKMRYKWRQWAVYPCNWKTAIEAFMEPYHVAGTHTQLLKYGKYYAYSKPYGLHGVSGFDEKDASQKTSQSTGVARAGLGDPRISTYELARENYETVNYAASTDTLVNAAKRLQDELPEGTPVAEVMAHWMASAKADDAARGVIWPEITPEQQAESGLAWSLFPNQTILHGRTFALCYRVRPYGDDPNKCIFESYALERYPEGEEPQTEWVYAEPSSEKWGMVLAQDFANMEFVQKGMKSKGFRGTLPNPHQEQKITNMHRHLARVLEGRGQPKLIKKS
ncbi:SRPBCC family protein [Pseudomaricurvus sp. HS19]|uniref:aromatic ring-hydroxylating oxygenase subunit alpha n=1 Tax=Pseudomaricurvus sp. HS19 TaxID=2692626 RepID=UPI001369DDED|nr:SRPBCC family protein [Pseudomaricurvus sp. HS19]MYM62406.1 Rieske 2Fe-2S domain-containing protein [Pseudomaricurvus sp. HS19]